MGLDQYAHCRNREVNWEKFYSDDEKESQAEQKDVFVWRKHARLQVFMNSVWNRQNVKRLQQKNKKKKDFFDMSHLGFNAGEEVYMTEDVVKELEKAIKEDYYHYFAHDGFFWGQQWQEEAVKEYKQQDQEFLQFCKDALKQKKCVIYTCSW